MAGVSWVAGTTGVMGSGTSIAATTPAGIADGDCLLAWVIARSTVTPPAGWTLVLSVAVTASSVTQTLHCFRKDTVVAGDSSTSYTFTQSSSLTYGICYQVVRAESGVVVLRNASSSTATGSGSITPPQVTADRGQEMDLIGAGVIVQTTGSYTPTPPTGFALSSGGVASNRCMACYRQVNEGYTNAGVFVVSATSTSNGTQAITLRATDQEEVVATDEGFEFVEDFDYSGSIYGDVMADVFGLHVTLGTLFQDALSDEVASVDLADSILPYLDEILEGLGASGVVAVVKAISASAFETLELADAAAYVAGVILAERLGVARSVLPNHKSGQTLLDTIRQLDALRAGRPVLLAEEVGLAELAAVVAATRVVEQLGLSEALAGAAQYGMTLSQGIRVVDALRWFVGLDLLDGVGLADTSAMHLRAAGALADTIGAADTLAAPQLVIRAVAADAVGIAPTQALKMVLGDTLADAVELSAAYISPGGGITTWAMNTRTGFVSEYQNYAFNSFARVGNRYLGASADGLFELSGDTDAGEAIIASLKGGFMQFGGTHLSRLKEAYIAVTGDEDEFILKIETLDGDTYVYRVDARSGRNTKVHMGKGMRARYFAYELTSVGQDFTLDTLEFVPIVVQRRV